MVYIGVYYDCWDLNLSPADCDNAYRDTAFELGITEEGCTGGCSSHGICVSGLTCKCFTGYSGSDCSTFTSASAPSGSQTICSAPDNLTPQYTPRGVVPVIDPTSTSCLCADGHERLACFNHFQPSNYTTQLLHNVTFSGRLQLRQFLHFHYIHASVCASFRINVSSATPGSAFDILASTKEARPTDSSQSLFSWGQDSLSISHRAPGFTNGTYFFTVRCRRGYTCDHVNVAVVETEVTSQTVSYTREVVGTQDTFLWTEICVVDGSRGLNLTSVLTAPRAEPSLVSGEFNLPWAVSLPAYTVSG